MAPPKPLIVTTLTATEGIASPDLDTNGGSVRVLLILIREADTSDNVATIEVDGNRLKITGNAPVLFDSGLDAGGYPVVGVAEPEADDHAATKRYVDDAIAAMTPQPARVAP